MNGSVVQAFLELSTKDNGNVRYRIQRHQLQGLFWRLEENNLVKQDYMWVGPGMNLSVVNYPVLSGDKILQYMSLVYWGNDDSPKYRPLNCAYVQADYLQFDSNVQADSTQIANPKNTQFVGYIEGLPPYYVNDSARRVPYEYTINASANAISEAEYEIKNGTSTDQSYSYNTKASVSCDFLFFESELSYSFGKKWGTLTGTLWLLLPQLEMTLRVRNYVFSLDILKKLLLGSICFLRTFPGYRMLTVSPPFPCSAWY